MKTNSKKIGRTISIVIIFTIIGKIFGFLREIMLSYFFGATDISDAYLISQTIPGTIFQFVGVGLTTCFVPVYFHVKNKNEDCVKYTNKILTLIFFFSLLVILAVWAWTPLVLKLFASGFNESTMYLGMWFTRIGVLSLFFSSMIYVFNSYLQANNMFLATAFSAIPNSLTIMVAIYLGSKYNIWLLSIGSALAVGMQLLFLIPSVKKANYYFRLEPIFRDENIVYFLRLLLPVLVGVSLTEINTIIDRTVASRTAEGGISALTYANSLIQFVQNGIVLSIVTVFYPKLSELVSKHENHMANKAMGIMVELTLGILMPLSIGFMLFASHITQTIFNRGAFDARANNMTSIAVSMYAIGICFSGMRDFYSRFFYAHSDTKTPMKNSSIGVACNIVLNILLGKIWGIGGLALATSISAIISSVLLIIDSAKKLPEGKLNIRMANLVNILLSALVAGLVAYFIYQLSYSVNSIWGLFMACIAGVTTYFCLGWLLKVRICKYITDYFSSKRRI